MSHEHLPTKSESWLGPVVRSALNALPFGGVLATAWSEWDTHRRFSNIDHMLLEFERALERRADFDANTVTDAEMHLLDLTLEKANREHREAKRRRFAHLLAHAWTEGIARPFDEKLPFLTALDEFDQLHIAVLGFLDEERGGRQVANLRRHREAIGYRQE